MGREDGAGPLLFQVRNVHGRSASGWMTTIRSTSQIDGPTGRFLVRLFCVNPAANLNAVRWSRGVSTVFFSATLLPVRYYRAALERQRVTTTRSTRRPPFREGEPGRLRLATDVSSPLQPQRRRNHLTGSHRLSSGRPWRPGNRGQLHGLLPLLPVHARTCTDRLRLLAEEAGSTDPACDPGPSRMTGGGAGGCSWRSLRRRARGVHGSPSASWAGIFSEGIDLTEETG